MLLGFLFIVMSFLKKGKVVDTNSIANGDHILHHWDVISSSSALPRAQRKWHSKPNVITLTHLEQAEANHVTHVKRWNRHQTDQLSEFNAIRAKIVFLNMGWVTIMHNHVPSWMIVSNPLVLWLHHLTTLKNWSPWDNGCCYLIQIAYLPIRMA